MSIEAKLVSLVQDLNYAASSNIFVSFSPGPEISDSFVFFSEKDSCWIIADRNELEVFEARGGIVLAKGSVDDVTIGQSDYLCAYDTEKSALLFEREVYSFSGNGKLEGLDVIWEAEA